MRIVAAHPGPQFSVHDVYVGWVEALRELGAKVLEFNLADRLTFFDSALFEISPNMIRKAVNHEQAIDLAVNGLYATLYQTRPDVLLVVSGFFLEPKLLDLVRRSGTRVVMLHTESPYEDDRQLELAPYVDLNLINDPTNQDAFTALAPTVYMPHAYRPTVHHRGPAVVNLAADLAFVGTGYESRIDFFDRMDLEGLDVLLGGNWQQLDDDSRLRKYVSHDLQECLDNAQAAQVYRSAQVGINLYRREAEAAHLAAGWSMGPREVEQAACGLFFLRDPRGEGDKVLPMLPTFDTPEQASELVRWYLDHDDERNRLAGEARRAVADRTFVNNAAALMQWLDRRTTT